MLYSPDQHVTWSLLFSRLAPLWERYANPHFLNGLQRLALSPKEIPQLGEINRRLTPLTGFAARAVGGYVAPEQFFAHLRRREFPTTVTIRDRCQLDYLPEPDIFHDVAGHVPMHTEPAFAEALVRFGECAGTAVEMGERGRENRMLALARFFWFTVEFGLMRSAGGVKAYGSGLMSSFGELRQAIESPEVRRCPIDLGWVVNQPFEIDHYQPLLFIVESLEQVYELAGQLEGWMKDRKLDQTSDVTLERACYA